jgi:hypothetical protein
MLSGRPTSTLTGAAGKTSNGREQALPGGETSV